MSKHILHVVTNVGSYDNPAHETGLWLSELVHAWNEFESKGYRQSIVSPQGGRTPLEPRSLKFPNYDRAAKAWHSDSTRMALLENTSRPEQILAAEVDAIFFTGGHAVMYDFPDSQGMQRLTREIWENGGVVSSVCHGYCGLLNTRLSDGSFLVAGRRITGFSWTEEVAARVNKLVPYNAETEMKNRAARYEKTAIPFLPHTVTDGNLVSGQNPGSAKATARAVIRVLEG